MKLDKKALVLFILLCSFTLIKAQHICPLDGNFALLYIKNLSEVTVSTKYYDASNKGVGGIYKFEKKAGKIISDDSHRYYYPEFIKIRNNDFTVSNTKDDSLLLDDKGRVITVYRSLDGSKKNFATIHIRYINDTTILENRVIPHSRDSSIAVYELDATFNLKAVKEGISKAPFFEANINDIDIFSTTKFVYTDLNKKVKHIQKFELDGTKNELQWTQTFQYKKNIPARSYVFDEQRKQITYKQAYSYKR